MPVLLWLASFLVSLFTSAVSFFMQYVTRRLAIIAAVVAAIGALTTAFFGTMYFLMSQIASVAPDFVVHAYSLCVPSNFPLLFSIWISARLARWVYEWNVKVVQMRLT